MAITRSNFSTGDVVRITKGDFEERHTSIDGLIYTEEMHELEGTTFTLPERWKAGGRFISNGRWAFHPDWLEHVRYAYNTIR